MITVICHSAALPVLLQVDLHPHTVLTLPGVWQGTSAWQGWGPAPDSSSSRDTAEAAADRVRWWAEQCDRLQGAWRLGTTGFATFGHRRNRQCDSCVVAAVLQELHKMAVIPGY
jgi:hypothetical protein